MCIGEKMMNGNTKIIVFSFACGDECAYQSTPAGVNCFAFVKCNGRPGNVNEFLLYEVSLF
jgi:hypothetical protein